MPRPTRPKSVPTRAAWPPWTSRTWVANRPPTPNIEMNESSSGISDTPPMSKFRIGAEDVVDEDGDEQQAAADQRAHDEDEDPRPGCRSSRIDASPSCGRTGRDGTG